MSAASVRIAAIIAVPSEGVGNTAIGTLQSLAASPEALTVALGFQVEKVDAVPTLVVSASETSNQDADQSNTGVSITFVMSLAAGVVVFVVTTFVVAVAVVWRRLSTKRRMGSDVGAVIQPTIVVASSTELSMSVVEHSMEMPVSVAEPSITKEGDLSQDSEQSEAAAMMNRVEAHTRV